MKRLKIIDVKVLNEDNPEVFMKLLKEGIDVEIEDNGVKND